jgi:hypothetical protein
MMASRLPSASLATRCSTRAQRQGRAAAEELERAIESMHENISSAGHAARVDLQDQDAAVRARPVRHDQRYRAEPGHRTRAAPPVRDLHQLEEHGSLPVGTGAHASGLGRVPQRAATAPSWSKSCKAVFDPKGGYFKKGGTFHARRWSPRSASASRTHLTTSRSPS